MSKFVQKSERSIELPLGCKDLLDVEAIRTWTPPELWLRTGPEVWWDRLAYCEGFLTGLLQSAGRTVLVNISVFQGSAHVEVFPGHTGPFVVAWWNGATQQQAVASAFEEAGVQIYGWVPHPTALQKLVRGLLVLWAAKRKNRRWLGCVLPGKPSASARLICQLLRNGYSLGALNNIAFSYHAPKKA
jgi:hypothetical protein